jgi:hypothetical protein
MTAFWYTVITLMMEAVRTSETSVYFYETRSWGISVNIVSGYGLDDRAIEVRSPAGAKDFPSSLCVQTGSEAYPTMDTGGPFPGCKARPGRDADHSAPPSADAKNE